MRKPEIAVLLQSYTSLDYYRMPTVSFLWNHIMGWEHKEEI